MRALWAVFLLIAGNLIPWKKKNAWRSFYQYLATLRPDTFTLMNYGYVGPTEIQLDSSHEDERFGLQLYHHVTETADLTESEILEVGCGRGGGIAYLSKYHHPKKAIGLDLSENAVNLCKSRHHVEGLEFVVGDAENLNFPDESFDYVVNIESAFCYPSRQKFYRQVYRTLRKGGRFLYADIEKEAAVPAIDNALEQAGFKIIKKESINENVIKACDRDSDRRKKIIDSQYHAFPIRIAFYNFAAVRGSGLYRKLKSGSIQYLCYIVEKPPSADQ